MRAISRASWLEAEGDGALGGEDGAAVAEEHALAGVVGVVDVGEVAAGGLDSAGLGVEGADRLVETGEDAGHGGKAEG